jgi:hypothetical protein
MRVAAVPQDEPVERPMPPKRVGGAAEEEEDDDVFPQAWSDGGKRCPEGTVPIRRTTARDVLRASSARRFGMKARASHHARRDSTSSGHEVSLSHQPLTFFSPSPRSPLVLHYCCSIKAGLVGGGEHAGIN